MIRVLGVGDNVCDKYLPAGMIYPGGNALNVAVFSKFMGCDSAYLGTIGDDETGQFLYAILREMGLDISHCRFEQGENGIARVELRDGDRVFLKGNRETRVSRTRPPVLSRVDIRYMESFDLLHTSIYSYMEPELPKMQEAGAFLSMDFSDAYDDAYLKRCCRYIDCAEISCGGMPEDEILETMERIMQYGCREMVIATRGSRGAMVLCKGKLYRQVPCLVKARDTMGAGDSFITSFLVNYLDAVRDATDFPEIVSERVCSKESGEVETGIRTAEGYRDALIRLSLYRAAVFAAQQCRRDGSFGFGKEIGVTEADLRAMKDSLS